MHGDGSLRNYVYGIPLIVSKYGCRERKPHSWFIDRCAECALLGTDFQASSQFKDCLDQRICSAECGRYHAGSGCHGYLLAPGDYCFRFMVDWLRDGIGFVLGFVVIFGQHNVFVLLLLLLSLSSSSLSSSSSSPSLTQ